MGRFRVIKYVGMFLNLHLHISHGLTDVIVTARTVSFIDHVWSMSVFVFQIEKAFDLLKMAQRQKRSVFLYTF